MRKCEHDHQGQGLSGEWAGVCPRPGRRLASPSRARALPGAAADARWLSPLPAGPVVARRHAGLRHRA